MTEPEIGNLLGSYLRRKHWEAELLGTHTGVKTITYLSQALGGSRGSSSNGDDGRVPGHEVINKYLE